MAKTLVGLLQRHGETTANADNQFRARLDPSLNKKGIAQAEKAAKNIAKRYGKVIKKVIASPMLRSMQTADIIAEELGLVVVQDRGLISWNLGFLSGKDKDLYQDILDFYIGHPKKEIPEGESLDALEKRTEEFFKEELKHEGTLYVTHNSNCVTLENLFLGNTKGRPESSEHSVEPGGTIGLYVDDDGVYSAEVVAGEENGGDYGS